MAKSNEPTITEMNEAIAVFMGYEKYKDNSGIWFKKVGLIISMHPKLEDLCYHEKWELLMPVVEKISKMPLLNTDNTECTDPQDVCYPRTFGMPTEDGKQVMVRFNGFGLHKADTLIEATHLACYDVACYEIACNGNNQQKQNNG